MALSTSGLCLQLDAKIDENGETFDSTALEC